MIIPISATYLRLAVYLVAHQDDWQLFMDPVISGDICDKSCRTVIIHTTAGDAGEDRRYWLAREQASFESLRFRMAERTALCDSKERVDILTKKIVMLQAENCILYFLRLPDGGMYGEGFERQGFSSLQKLRSGMLGQLADVDGENCYQTWTELTIVLNAIILLEGRRVIADLSGRISTTLHFPDIDEDRNPQDHNDHHNTARLAMALLPGVTDGIAKYAYVHYNIQHMAAELRGDPLFWKSGMFAVYHACVERLHGYSTVAESAQYLRWPILDCMRTKIN